MLASLNINETVYAEPNQYTWKILRKNYSKYYKGDALDERIAILKQNKTKTVKVRGNAKQLIEFSMWELMNIFGEHMYMGNSEGQCFTNNAIYCDLDQMTPIIHPVSSTTLGEPVTYVLPPKSNTAISTGLSAGDSVRVKFVNDSGNILAAWGNKENTDSARLSDILFDNRENGRDYMDYLVENGKEDIILFNNTDREASCKICYAAIREEK